MKSIVVGGHSRNVGKTSLAAALIRAFKGYQWTAVKISAHRHGLAKSEAVFQPSCHCEIHEEVNPYGLADSSRFLAAGACRSFWVYVNDNHAEEGLRGLLSFLQEFPYVLVESNRILNVMRPDFCLMVLRPDVGEFKASAQSFLHRADAFIEVNPNAISPVWENALPPHVPRFLTPSPDMIPIGLLDVVRSALLYT